MTPDLLTLDNAPAGIQTSEELAVAHDATKFWLTLTRDNWPDTGEVVVQAGLEISYDDGATWQYFAEFRMEGGGPFSESVMSSDIPETPIPLSPEHDPPSPPEPPLRRVRASVKNLVTISTTVTFGLE